MSDLPFHKCLTYITGCSVFIGQTEFLSPINGKFGKGYLAWFYGALLLLPIIWIVDGLGPNIELFAQPFHQFLYPFNLEVGWKGGFGISYNTDADSLTAVALGSAWYD